MEVNVDVIWSIVYGFGVVISIIASAVVFLCSTSAFVLDWIQYCRLEATFQSGMVVGRLDCLFCMKRVIDFAYRVVSLIYYYSILFELLLLNFKNILSSKIPQENTNL